MVGTGIIYPLAMTGLAQVLFNHQANGSLIKNARGQVVGSSLIGQNFTRPQYFHPRLSAAGKGYDATSSGGTNLGPTNKVLVKNTIAQANLIRKENNLQATVRSLVKQNTSDRTLGVLGEPRINVLQLNLALDRSKR
jgi:K+-transporting ATPase ATPase C chain